MSGLAGAEHQSVLREWPEQLELNTHRSTQLDLTTHASYFDSVEIEAIY